MEAVDVLPAMRDCVYAGSHGTTNVAPRRASYRYGASRENELVSRIHRKLSPLNAFPCLSADRHRWSAACNSHQCVYEASQAGGFIRKGETS